MGHFRKQQITIFPTNTCNMSCTYCVASKCVKRKYGETINLNFAKKGIEDYFSSENRHQIRFYANGEPTQGFEVIKECWDFSYDFLGKRKLNNKLISEIQTNCYFDRNISDWIGDHINYVWASIDGWPKIQNKYRCVAGDNNPSHVIIKNVKNILSRMENNNNNKDSFVGARATIVEETVDKQIEILKYFREIGITEVCSEPCFAPVESKFSNNGITLVNLEKYIFHFVEAWHQANEWGMNYMNSFMVNFDENVELACRSCLPTPHLTVDGYVSACDLGFHGQTSLGDLIYGKYNENTNEIEYWSKAIQKLRTRRCDNIKQCQSCEIQHICGGGCLGRAYHETHDFYGVIEQYCWATKYLAKNLDLKLIKFPHLHP